MQIKILIDVDHGKSPVIRVTNPNGASMSDDVKDKLIRIFLEEVGINSGLLSMYYSPEGDAIIRPADYHIALSTIASRFYGDHRVKALIQEALEELDKSQSPVSSEPPQ